MADGSHDDDLSTDYRPGPSSSSHTAMGDLKNAPVEVIQQLLQREQAAHAETTKDLEVERAAHDETAEKMVQLQQRLEVTLQELANLERFTKRQQYVESAPQKPSHIERLLKEESYLKARLVFVQQELSEARGISKPEAADAEERVLESALTI
uniref:Uncharacterized protein n=1 Tax=Haptolina brevifila TaxID=156173 RepID=A0A7S2HBT0_9EUKA